MDPDTLKSLISQAPGTAAVIVVVIVFLKFVRSAMDDWKAFFKTVTDEQNSVIERNTELAERNIEALGHASAIFGKNKNGL